MNKHKLIQIVMATLLITAVLSMGAFGQAGARQKPPVHLIPCPNAEVDSADAIMEAIATAEEDEIIQLEACTYYLAKVVEVRTAFHGWLRGAGKDLTVIKILPGHKIQAIDLGIWPGYYGSFLFFMVIPEGQAADIRITDLSMVVTDPEPAIGQTDDEGLGHALIAFTYIMGSEANTSFERLRLTGSEGNYNGHNMVYGVGVDSGGPVAMKGNHTLSNIDITHVHVGYNTFNLWDGKIKVTGNTFHEITGTTYTPEGIFYGSAMVVFDVSNSQVEITSNEIDSPGSMGILLLQGLMGPPEGPSTFLIARNHFAVDQEGEGRGIYYFQAPSSSPTPVAASKLTITKNDIQTNGLGIVVEDVDYSVNGFTTLHTVISNNKIFMNDALYGAIYLAGGQGARIIHNRIYGKGDSGIAMGIFPENGERVEGCFVKNNVFSNFEYRAADIWLGTESSNCKVVGGSFRPDVLDQGTDNILIGVNELTGMASLQLALPRLGFRSPLEWMRMLGLPYLR